MASEVEEEFEHFDDFTLASSWERFISEIEGVCRQWFAHGTNNFLKKDAICLNNSDGLYKVKADLKYAMKSYCMEYYFVTHCDGKVNDWSCALLDLQLFFGVNEFLVIAPQSASGVILDGPESSKLLSAVAIALSNCSSLCCKEQEPADHLLMALEVDMEDQSTFQGLMLRLASGEEGLFNT